MFYTSFFIRIPYGASKLFPNSTVQPWGNTIGKTFWTPLGSIWNWKEQLFTAHDRLELLLWLLQAVSFRETSLFSAFFLSIFCIIVLLLLRRINCRRNIKFCCWTQLYAHLCHRDLSTCIFVSYRDTDYWKACAVPSQNWTSQDKSLNNNFAFSGRGDAYCRNEWKNLLKILLLSSGNYSKNAFKTCAFTTEENLY